MNPMKKSSIGDNQYLGYLWELGELPVYIYWWCWRFAAPVSLGSGHSGNQGFFTLHYFLFAYELPEVLV